MLHVNAGIAYPISSLNGAGISVICPRVYLLNLVNCHQERLVLGKINFQELCVSIVHNTSCVVKAGLLPVSGFGTKPFW